MQDLNDSLEKELSVTRAELSRLQEARNTPAPPSDTSDPTSEDD